MSSLDKDVRLLGVLSTHIDEVWNDCKQYIINAIKYSDGKYSIEDIYNYLKNNHMQLWLIFNNAGLCGAVVTEVKYFPQCRRLTVVFCGGKGVHQWIKHSLSEIVLWAKKLGCDAIDIYGRPGWERIIDKFGFKKIHTVYKLLI